MRREERVTVQGPAKKQPDGMSHGGGGRLVTVPPRGWETPSCVVRVAVQGGGREGRLLAACVLASRSTSLTHLRPHRLIGVLPACDNARPFVSQVLLFQGQRLILIHLRGSADAIRDFIANMRTCVVDVDSKGRKCKERMMKVLAQDGAAAAPGEAGGAGLSVRRLAERGDLEAFLGRCGFAGIGYRSFFPATAS